MANDYLDGILADFNSYKNVPAIDPRNSALMSAGFGILAGNQPSRLPTNPWGVLAQGGMAGMQAYQGAREQQLSDIANRMKLGVLAEQIKKSQRERELQEMLTKGGLSADPETLERVGILAAAGGHPGGATFITQADKRRQALADRETAQGFKSAPGILGAGVTTSSPQGQMLAGQMSGDPTFDAAMLRSTNEALNSNPRLAPQPLQAPRPGLFGVLSDSPYVGPYARSMQAQLDQSRNVPPKTWLDEFNRLQQQHQTGTNAALAREENAALRRELAQFGAANRQGAQQGVQEQRLFQREHQLSQDYNALSKPYRNTLPAFQSSAQYIAGQKYDSSGDRALAFSYAKMLDPSDRVGVNDIRDIAKLGNVPERITQAIVGLAEGKELPDRVRREMFDTMRSRFEALNEQQRQIEDEYEQRARGYMLNPGNVVIRHSNRGGGSKPRGGASGQWSIERLP